MTREEAIEILQGAIEKPNTKDGYLGQAIDMAIKALEQEPTTKNDLGVDLISRADALALYCDKCALYNCTSKCASYRAVEKMPSVTPQEPCDKCEVGNPCLYCKHEFEPQESEDKE